MTGKETNTIWVTKGTMDYSEGFVDLTGEEEAGLYAVRDPSLEIPQLLRLKRVALTGPSGETIYISTLIVGS